MRVIFMGTPEFAVPALQQLINDSYFDVSAVFTRPPKPQNRGHHVHNSPVHSIALKHNIPVFTPLTLKDIQIQKAFREFNADFAVVAAYGLILPKEILKGTQYGCLNIHASLLPRWRGAAPIQRAILTGDKETGITIMQMDEGLDTGNMLIKRAISIQYDDTMNIIYRKLASLGAELIREALINYHSITPEKQEDQYATYAPKLNKEEGIIDFSRDAEILQRQVQALNPWPGTFFSYQNETFKILKLKIIKEANLHPNEMIITSEYWYVGCGTGAISIEEIQKSGGKPLKIKEFLRGSKLFHS